MPQAQLAPTGSGYPAPVVPGNIEWYGRPRVKAPSGTKTPEGDDATYGSVHSASREEDGLEVLYPQIYDGKWHSDDEAWQHYKKTGQHMGKFRSPKDADSYAIKYHRDAAAGKFDSRPTKESNNMEDNSAPVGVPPQPFGPQQVQSPPNVGATPGAMPSLAPSDTSPSGTGIGTPGQGAPGQSNPSGGPRLVPRSAASNTPNGPSPEAVKAQTEHQTHGMWGRAARFLLGNQVDYQVDDKGNVQSVPIKQKPGQMFRSLLAGAILGGAMGAEAHRGFSGGFVAGAAGVQDRQAQADQSRYQRAVGQFNMRQKAQQDLTEEQLRHAQIAHFNAATATENFILNKSVFGQNVEAAQLGKEQLQPLVDAGVPYAFRDIPASQMEQVMKTNPDAAKLQWAPTSYTLKRNEKGESYPELHYSAVDPKGKIKLTAGVLKQFEDAKLGDFFPGIKDLKPGQEVDANSYVDLLTKYRGRYNDQMQKTQTDLTQQRFTAETKKLLAERAHLLSEVSKNQLQGKELDQFKQAEKKFAEVGYDPTKLDPESYAVMAKEAGGFLKEETSLLNKAMTQDPQMEEPGTQQLYGNVTQLSDWVKYVFVPRPKADAGGAPGDRVQQIVQDVTGKGSTIDSDGDQVNSTKLSPQESFQKIASSNLSDPEKIDAWRQSGAEYPWSLVVEQARKRGIPADQIADGLKKSGINVGKSETGKARDDMAKIPPSAFRSY